MLKNEHHERRAERQRTSKNQESQKPIHIHSIISEQEDSSRVTSQVAGSHHFQLKKTMSFNYQIPKAYGPLKICF